MIHDSTQEAYAEMERNREWTEEGYPGGLFLRDERLIRFFKETWQRLPEYDREFLEYLIGFVREAGAFGLERGAGRAGHASAVQGESVADGVPYIADGTYEIVLYLEDLEGRSDAFIVGVIAHELAHAVLRHISMAPSREFCWKAYPEAAEMIGRVHEWEADHRAWVWGFHEEIQEVWSTLGQEDVPWLFRYELNETEE